MSSSHGGDEGIDLKEIMTDITVKNEGKMMNEDFVHTF